MKDEILFVVTDCNMQHIDLPRFNKFFAILAHFSGIHNPAEKIRRCRGGFRGRRYGADSGEISGQRRQLCLECGTDGCYTEEDRISGFRRRPVRERYGIESGNVPKKNEKEDHVRRLCKLYNSGCRRGLSRQIGTRRRNCACRKNRGER